MIKKVKKGFTLIELVVVIAVIAILSAVSVVAYVGITNSAKKSSAQQEADQIAFEVRTAAQTNADGYKEQYEPNASKTATESPRYAISFSAEGLTIENKSEAVLSPVEVLIDVYEELEESTYALGTITVIADDLSTGSHDLDANGKIAVSDSITLARFHYSHNADVVASFVK